jgi:hypothetical protein
MLFLRIQGELVKDAPVLKSACLRATENVAYRVGDNAGSGRGTVHTIGLRTKTVNYFFAPLRFAWHDIEFKNGAVTVRAAEFGRSI